MHIPASLTSSSTANASVSTGVIATVQSATQEGAIHVSPLVYSLLAVLLGFAGVWLARLVTIDTEDKRLGRRQTRRETVPLTLIGALIVCPLIWQFNLAVPWASMIGLGVGYSVKLVLKIFGGGAVSAARAIARRAADELIDDQEEDRKRLEAPRVSAPAAPRLQTGIIPADKPMEGTDELIADLDRLPSSTGTGGAPPRPRRLPSPKE